MGDGSTKIFMESEEFGIHQNWSCFLVDNGSLRPEPVLQLREIACSLGALLEVPVHPVGLLHSAKVDPARLGGIPALEMEPALENFLEFPLPQDVVVLPQFFGPSRALTEFLPWKLRELGKKAGERGIQLRQAAGLYDPGDDSGEVLSGILADRVGEVMKAAQWTRLPRVILVDHGSAVPEVVAARRAVARELRVMLSGFTCGVVECSMERPDGADAQVSPLLSEVLEQAQGDEPLVLAMMFFANGRHAGPGGDVEQICREHAKGEWVRTAPIGNHPALVQLLAKRAVQAMQ